MKLIDDMKDVTGSMSRLETSHAAYASKYICLVHLSLAIAEL